MRAECPRCGDTGPLGERCGDCGCARYGEEVHEDTIRDMVGSLQREEPEAAGSGDSDAARMGSLSDAAESTGGDARRAGKGDQ